MLQACLPPEVSRHCNWDALRLEGGSFVDPSLRAMYSDLLYSVIVSSAIDLRWTAEPEEVRQRAEVVRAGVAAGGGVATRGERRERGVARLGASRGGAGRGSVDVACKPMSVAPGHGAETTGSGRH